MTLYTNSNGIWKPVTSLNVNSGGAVKPVISGNVNVNGVWKEFYSSVKILSQFQTSRTGTGTNPNTYNLQSNIPLGPEKPDRLLVVVAESIYPIGACRLNNAAGPVFTEVASFGTTNCYIKVFTMVIPTGSVATVVVQNAGSLTSFFFLGYYTLSGYANRTPVNTLASPTTADSAKSLSDIPDGISIAYGMTVQNPAGVLTGMTASYSLTFSAVPYYGVGGFSSSPSLSYSRGRLFGVSTWN